MRQVVNELVVLLVIPREGVERPALELHLVVFYTCDPERGS